MSPESLIYSFFRREAGCIVSIGFLEKYGVFYSLSHFILAGNSAQCSMIKGIDSKRRTFQLRWQRLRSNLQVGRGEKSSLEKYVITSSSAGGKKLIIEIGRTIIPTSKILRHRLKVTSMAPLPSDEKIINGAVPFAVKVLLRALLFLTAGLSMRLRIQ